MLSLIRYERIKKEYLKKNKKEYLMNSYYFLSRTGGKLFTSNIGQVVHRACNDLQNYSDYVKKRIICYNNSNYMGLGGIIVFKDVKEKLKILGISPIFFVGSGLAKRYIDSPD